MKAGSANRTDEFRDDLSLCLDRVFAIQIIAGSLLARDPQASRALGTVADDLMNALYALHGSIRDLESLPS